MYVNMYECVWIITFKYHVWFDIICMKAYDFRSIQTIQTILKCAWTYVNLCEFIWINMNLHMDYAAVWQCSRVRQCERQCVAVCAVVCAQCARHCAAVCLLVYGIARGSMRLCGSAAVCGSVRQCAWLCVAVPAAVCGNVWRWVVVPAHVTVSVRLCASLRIYTQSRPHNTFFPYRGNGNDPFIPRIYIATDQCELLIQIKVI
jgi:hypothetical protein